MSDLFQHLTKNNAAENNKSAILSTLSKLNLVNKSVFELGSGTGQHGIYFCQNAPELIWQLTESESQLPTLNSWYEAAKPLNLRGLQAPKLFQIGNSELKLSGIDYVYSANVIHIISNQLAKQLVEQLTENLSKDQLVIFYGPFKQNQGYTTESNQEFDLWLKSQGYGGFVDMTDIEQWSAQQLKLIQIESMPANNFLLIYRKQ